MIDDIYDKILGMMVAHGLGDALGLPHKKFTSKIVYRYTGKLEFKSNSLQMYKSEAGRKYYVIGQTSDDNEKSLNILRSLNRYRGYNKEDIVMSYIAWANQS